MSKIGDCGCLCLLMAVVSTEIVLASGHIQDTGTVLAHNPRPNHTERGRTVSPGREPEVTPRHTRRYQLIRKVSVFKTGGGSKGPRRVRFPSASAKRLLPGALPPSRLRVQTRARLRGIGSHVRRDDAATDGDHPRNRTPPPLWSGTRGGVRQRSETEEPGQHPHPH